MKRWQRRLDDRSGLVVLLAGAVMLAAFLVPGRTGTPGSSGTIYGASRWALLALLVLAGTAVSLTITRRHRQAAATAGALAALQLAATGLVGFRRWVSVAGVTGYGAANPTTVRALSLLLAAAGLAALAALLVALGSDAGGASLVGVTRGTALPAAGTALVVAVGLPFVLGAGEPRLLDATSLLANAALYSLPLAAGLAVSGVLTATLARACLLTTAGSALLCLLLSGPADQLVHPWLGFGAVAGCALVLLAQRTAGVSRVAAHA